ncbi:MAG: hypothetical protein WBQ25_12665 [Nitrososphaeraceae archaeon]
MTTSNSTKNNIDVPISFPTKFPKKVFRVSGKSIIVIHEDLVEQLGIDDQTWLEEEMTNDGILLRISSWRDEIGSQE